jgi:predicted nucleic acid-binding protein
VTPPLPDDPPQLAVLDTNVLYAMPLADTLLSAAEQRLFFLRWTADIMRELQRTMLAQQLPAQSVERRVVAIQEAFADGEELGYEALIASLQLPDPDDRHVLAAAIHAGATVIVTQNLKHFPPDVLLTYGTTAVGPDEFLQDLTDRVPYRMLEVVHRQASRLQHPAITFESLVDRLALHAPRFTATLRTLEATRQPDLP